MVTDTRPSFSSEGVQSLSRLKLSTELKQPAQVSDEYSSDLPRFEEVKAKDRHDFDFNDWSEPF